MFFLLFSFPFAPCSRPRPLRSPSHARTTSDTLSAPHRPLRTSPRPFCAPWGSLVPSCRLHAPHHHLRLAPRGLSSAPLFSRPVGFLVLHPSVCTPHPGVCTPRSIVCATRSTVFASRRLCPALHLLHPTDAPSKSFAPSRRRLVSRRRHTRPSGVIPLPLAASFAFATTPHTLATTPLTLAPPPRAAPTRPRPPSRLLCWTPAPSRSPSLASALRRALFAPRAALFAPRAAYRARLAVSAPRCVVSGAWPSHSAVSRPREAASLPSDAIPRPSDATPRLSDALSRSAAVSRPVSTPRSQAGAFSWLVAPRGPRWPSRRHHAPRRYIFAPFRATVPPPPPAPFAAHATRAIGAVSCPRRIPTPPAPSCAVARARRAPSRGPWPRAALVGLHAATTPSDGAFLGLRASATPPHLRHVAHAAPTHPIGDVSCSRRAPTPFSTGVTAVSQRRLRTPLPGALVAPWCRSSPSRYPAPSCSPWLRAALAHHPAPPHSHSRAPSRRPLKPAVPPSYLARRRAVVMQPHVVAPLSLATRRRCAFVVCHITLAPSSRALTLAVAPRSPPPALCRPRAPSRTPFGARPPSFALTHPVVSHLCLLSHLSWPWFPVPCCHLFPAPVVLHSASFCP
ncbi:hypothetical protein DENSPDRAFT_886469 [Dentipellis sp. KUC8613]|nr:hypothetical protein DENSPDRAFT_886469 [Dentipellis sp. KUC8613]